MRRQKNKNFKNWFKLQKVYKYKVFYNNKLINTENIIIIDNFLYLFTCFLSF